MDRQETQDGTAQEAKQVEQVIMFELEEVEKETEELLYGPKPRSQLLLQHDRC